MPSVDLYAGLADGYRLQFSIIQQSQSQSANTSYIYWSLALLKGSGSGKWMSGASYWSITIDGQYREGSIGGYDFRSTNLVLLGQGYMTIAHNSDGTKTISGQAGFDDNNTYGELGDGQIGPGPLLTLTRIPRVPNAPATPVFSSSTPTSVTYTFAAPNNNGSSITTFNHQAATNSAFTAGVKNWNDGSTPTTATGLTPGTRYYFRTRAVNGVGAGPWSGTMQAVTPAALPSAPTGLAASNVTPTGFTVTYTRGNGNGSPLDTADQVQYSTSNAFTSATTVTATGTANLTGLSPGTTYYVRARSHTAAGYGPWSSTLTQTTLPSSPPGMVVTASVDGRSAVVALSAPGGVTGVSQYTVSYRRTGTTTPVTVRTTTTTSLTVTGLTPGQRYDWQATATIGAYVSPATAWLTVQQPAPNTNPGDYFDGATTDTPDVDYAWTGTANNSASTATGREVAGWMNFADGAGASGGTGVVARVTGGRTGSFKARTSFFSDTTAAGFAMGTDTALPGLAEVVDGATYVGSLWVTVPRRSQNLAAQIAWFDDSLVPLGITTGTAVLVPADTEVRLIVTGVAPVTDGAYASVRVVDVAGDGWSLWLGGQTLEADEAMLTLSSLFDYFDGSTPDTSAYAYAWLGDDNASVSIRTTLDQTTVNPLLDPDCPPVPSPPRPPAIDDDCIVEVGLWRRYWVTIPASEVTKWLAVIPTVRITTGADDARQVRLRVYPNPDNLVPSAMPQEAWEAEQIVSYIPPETTLVLDGVTRRAWANVEGYPQQLEADHLLYGTGGTPATWPLLDCGIGYLMSFDAPVDAPADNIEVTVGLTLRAT